MRRAAKTDKENEMTGTRRGYGMSRKPLRKRRERLFLFCMLILPFTQWLVFWLYVNFSSIILAFQDQRTGAWTFSNFSLFWDRLTLPDGIINIAVKNTMRYFGAELIVILPLSVVIAYFLYKRILFYKGFRIIFYLPAIISAVAMVTSFTNFIDPRGPLGTIAKLFGLKVPPEGFLGKQSTATWTIVVYSIWTGFCSNVLLFGGAMTRIPIDVLESARIEGSGPLVELVRLILPLIWSSISTIIVFQFTGIFSSSGPILLFTNGDFDTTTISFWIFQQVYGSGVFGGTGSYNLVSCAGLCFTLVGVPIILFIRWLMERIPAVEY